jgi:hypothetical protein
MIGEPFDRLAASKLAGYTWEKCAWVNLAICGIYEGVWGRA